MASLGACPVIVAWGLVGRSALFRVALRLHPISREMGVLCDTRLGAVGFGEYRREQQLPSGHSTANGRGLGLFLVLFCCFSDVCGYATDGQSMGPQGLSITDRREAHGSLGHRRRLRATLPTASRPGASSTSGSASTTGVGA